MQRDIDDRHELVLGPEWDVDEPLWDATGGKEFSGDELPLSDEVRARLTSWQRTWETSFDLDSEWASATARDSWLAEGDSLLRRLQSAPSDTHHVMARFRLYS